MSTQRLYSSYADYNSQRMKPPVSIIQPRERLQNPSVWTGVSPTRSSFEPTTPANDYVSGLDSHFKNLGLNDSNHHSEFNDDSYRAGHDAVSSRQTSNYYVKNNQKLRASQQEYANPYSKEAYESKALQNEHSSYTTSTFRSSTTQNQIYTDINTPAHYTEINDYAKYNQVEQPLRSRNYSGQSDHSEYSYFPELQKRPESKPRPTSSIESRLFEPHARSSTAFDHSFKFGKGSDLQPIGFEGSLRRSRTFSTPVTHLKHDGTDGFYNGD